MRRSLENGVTEIDNNRCEQSIRPIALGRKNWLHIGAPGAAPSVDAIISVVESCKRMGINVRSYLSDVLPRLAAAHPDQVAALAATLTPGRWLAVRTPAAAQAPAAGAGNPAWWVAETVTFLPFPMAAPQTPLNAQGKLEFLFTLLDNAAFFRVKNHGA